MTILATIMRKDVISFLIVSFSHKKRNDKMNTNIGVVLKIVDHTPTAICEIL